jgi:hypothetical protein
VTNIQELRSSIDGVDFLDRGPVVKFIRAALRARSGKAWSVTGGTGTAYGWLSINVPPQQRGGLDGMPPDVAAELAELLGFHHAYTVSPQGVNIPDGRDYYREYCYRAVGLTPPVVGRPYWD